MATGTRVDLEDGTVHWLDENRRLHRDEDLPAEIKPNGDKYWWRHGVPWRDDDKPAFETADGSGMRWLDTDGKIHRDGDKPAHILPTGIRVWYRHGTPWRGDGKPTMELEDGHFVWLDADYKIHRDNDLPAVVDPTDHRKEWWVHGQRWRAFKQPTVVTKDAEVWRGQRNVLCKKRRRKRADGKPWFPRVVKAFPDTTCAVCLEPYGGSTGCGPPVVICLDQGHSLCEKCLQTFMDHGGHACPKCRGPLMDTILVMPPAAAAETIP